MVANLGRIIFSWYSFMLWTSALRLCWSFLRVCSSLLMSCSSPASSLLMSCSSPASSLLMYCSSPASSLLMVCSSRVNSFLKGCNSDFNFESSMLEIASNNSVSVMISPPCRKNDVVNQKLYDLRWLDIRPLSAPDTCIISEVGKKVINYFSKYLQIILKPF